MAGMPHRSIRIVLFALLALLAAPLAHAHAGSVVAANYAPGGLEYAPGSPIANCRGWSGGSDDAGHFYVPCPGPSFPYVYEFDSQGRYLRYAALPASYLFDGTYRMRDVAVSPDGRTMYVSAGPIVDDLGNHPERPGGSYAGAILKFNRQLDGSWAHDAAWRAGPFLLGGRYWAPRYLTVDAAGRLYAGVNAFVYELSPANGATVGTFGGVSTAFPGGPWVDGIDVALGLAVAADGASMFVVEQRHHILQRWVRDAAGWRRDRTWGPNGTGIVGEPSKVDAAYCQRGDRFQSPYDIGVDAAGELYVADTSCHRIMRFTAQGQYVQTVWSNGYAEELVHGMAVNPDGSVVIPELELTMIRTDPARRPCVDAAAPVITGVGLPTRTASRAITITATGTDDCSKIVAVRVSGAVLGTPAWVDGASAPAQLSGWNGTKTLRVEARDVAGNVGVTTTRIGLAMPQPRLRARGVAKLDRTRGCRSTHPLRALAKASSYRVVGRCTRLAGTVTRTRGRGARLQVEVQLSLGVARSIYTNAVGPVRVWVMADRRTKVRRAPKAGRRMVVVAPLVAPRSGGSVYAVPADAIA